MHDSNMKISKKRMREIRDGIRDAADAARLHGDHGSALFLYNLLERYPLIPFTPTPTPPPSS